MTELQPNPLVNPNPTTTTMVDNRPKLASMYRVLLHDDDVNDMGQVVESLRQVFQFAPEQCISIMMEAHNSGVALCTVEYLEHAELHQEQLHALALTSTIEPED